LEETLKRLLVAAVAVGFVVVSAVLVWEMVVEAPSRPGEVAVSGIDGEGLEGEVPVRWTGDGAAVIDASAGGGGAETFGVALGYAHGSERAWTAELRRRTALGTLAEWFGGDALPLDRHARHLGLAHGARRAYEELPASQQRLLRAYARGMNAALASERVRTADAFVLLDVDPGTWEPWHALAVERLVAWLATPPLTLPGAGESETTALDPHDAPGPRSGRGAASGNARLPSALRAFVRHDRLLRRWLHVHGFERSVAWTVRDTTLRDTTTQGSARTSSARRVLFQRHVTGASALPFFQEIVWKHAGGRRSVLATVPGTLLFPAGNASPGSREGNAPAGGRSWSVLLGSRPELVRTPVDTTRIADRFERLSLRSGTETLARVLRAELSSGPVLPFPAPPDTSRLARLDTTAAPDSLVRVLRSASNPHARLARHLASLPAPAADSLLRPPSPVDSTWVLRWPGFEAGTDLGAWLHLAGVSPAPDSASAPPDSAESTGFRLLDGVGVQVNAGGTWTVMGDPPVVEALPGGVFVGRSAWGRFQAEALRDKLRRGTAVRPGVWASSDSSLWAARTLPAFAAALDPLEGGPPAVRDAVTYLRNWNHVYDRASIGATLFDRWMRAYRRTTGSLPTAADSTYFGDYLRRRALVRAVDSLAASQGRDLRQWRWERVAPDRRFFPVFSADSLVDQDLASLQRTRFAPLDRPGRGHPSTLAGGPTLVAPARLGPAPASWEGWTDPLRTRLTARRLQFDPSTFLARPFLEGSRPAPVAMDSLEIEAETVLR
jgi:hypothetical protein